MGWGNAGLSAVRLYVGEGPRGSNGTCSTLHRISITPSATHNQIGPLWYWFPSGWSCARSRLLWVSPTTSPVRLGVSPAATPTPTGVFSQRFEALFPPRWSRGLRGLLCSPRFILVYLCTSVGPRGATRCSACPVLCHTKSGPLGLSVCKCGAAGSASGQTACPFRPPHTPPVSVPPRPRESSPPWLPISAPPTCLDVCFFFIYLVSDFLAVRFSVSSGCARRRSVSTYAAMLVLSWVCLYGPSF